MKIAYFTDMFLPQANGVGTSLANQARILGEQGHQVLIFTPNFNSINREKFKAENVTVVSLPSVPSLFYTEFKFVVPILGLPKMLYHLQKFKPDIMHLHTTIAIGIDTIIANKLFKKPLVGTIHIYFTNSDFLRYFKSKTLVRLISKLAIPYVKFLYNQSHLLLTPSKTLIEELKTTDFKKTVHYQPNGVYLKQPKQLTSNEKAEIKKKYGLKKKVVLHFGRLSYEKNVDLLIKSFHNLTKNHSDVSLLIIGDGPSKNSLVNLAKKLGEEENIVFTGFIDHKILISSGLLSVGDIFATASNMEVNPMVVLEAMLYGLPIVGVRQAGMIELITNNGFLVKPGDGKELTEKMEKVLYNDRLAQKMREQSLSIIQLYSVDNTTVKLLQFYQDLISKNQ